MLVAAAVCPHPPLLVPEVAEGATAETADLRAACAAAVASLGETEPDLLVVVGDAADTRPVAPGTRGTFAGFGVPREVVLGESGAEPVTRRSGDPDAAPADVLSLSLAVGAWLLETSRGRSRHRGYGVGRGLSSTNAASVGVTLAGQAKRVALLVMGDGSARRTEKAPGALDERAAIYDATVVAALARADCDAILDLNPDLADELMVAGRVPWQVLAGAAWGTAWRTEVTYDDAPYGVGYFVATWRRAPA